jgi:hypothetical protein
MIFLNFVGLLLLLAGPIAGYWIATRQTMATRWQVLVWSATGGAVAADVFIGLLLLAELLPNAPTRNLVRPVVASVGWCAVFGLVLGFAGLVPRRAGTPRLVVTGLAMVVLLTLARLAFNAATHRPPEPGAAGVVFGPGAAPAAGAPVFVDLGAGEGERQTTDAMGVFHLPRSAIGPRQLLVLICVPGGVPYVARADDHMLTTVRYDVTALPPRAIVQPGIRALGWRRPIPRECLAGSAEPQQVISGEVATAERGVAQQSGTAKPTAADHEEFVGWPRELAPRAPVLADAIQRAFRNRPYVMTFAGRDTMDITFSDPSFWRNDVRPEFPRNSMPVVSKAARQLAWFVLSGFGRAAGINVVRVTFIRVREENQLGVTHKVPAQEVSILYSRAMFEPGSKEGSMFTVTER